MYCQYSDGLGHFIIDIISKRVVTCLLIISVTGTYVASQPWDMSQKSYILHSHNGRCVRNEKTRNERRKLRLFWRQLNEKASIIPGCPGRQMCHLGSILPV